MIPVCNCHGQPKVSVPNKACKNGRYWACSIARDEANKRYRDRHREHRRQESRDWYWANRDKAIETSRKYRENNHEKALETTRQWRKRVGYRFLRHHINFEIAINMYKEQGEKCAGCNKKRKLEELDVDHDHSCCNTTWSCGECIRGLLCDSCNLKDVLAV